MDGSTNQSSNQKRGRSVLPVAALRQKDTREIRTNNNINNSNYSGNTMYQNMQQKLKNYNPDTENCFRKTC